MVLSFSACSNNSPSKDDSQNQATGGEDVQIPNPFVDCAAMADAEKIAGFNVTLPEEIPEGYTQKLIQAVENEMIQVSYESGEKELIIRKAISTAKSGADISGDYNEYKENNTLTVGSLKVSTRGNDGKVNTATWVDGEYSYSITANLGETGLDTAAISDMAAAIR